MLFTPTVRYRYEIDGKPQESTQIAIGVVSGGQAAAEKICAKYPVSTEVPVFHHPRLHYLAVLEPGRFVLPLLATLLTGPVAYVIIGLWISKSVNPKTGPWKHLKHTSIILEQTADPSLATPTSVVRASCLHG